MTQNFLSLYRRVGFIVRNFMYVMLYALLTACGDGNNGGTDNGNANGNGSNAENPPPSAGPSVIGRSELLAGNIGGHGNADGVGAAASFSNPTGVAVDAAGNVYVADTLNGAIRKISPDGVVTTLLGRSFVDPDGTIFTQPKFYTPVSIALDSTGNLYVADSTDNTIRKITPAGVLTTLAGSSHEVGTADGTGAAARFTNPSGVATDIVGNVYVADTDHGTIRKITPAGVVTTLTEANIIDGELVETGGVARFSRPLGVAVDRAGNVYVAEWGMQRIRKITPAGIVTTFAGTAGVIGSSDGTGPAASFAGPSGITTDANDNVYVADHGNQTIRKITPGGVVTTLAGTAGVYGAADGIGAMAQFSSPDGIATDTNGNVYVADRDNQEIRKISPSGVVKTLAGAASIIGTADGIGTAAQFSRISGLGINHNNNVYVVDTGNQTIRKITPTGEVTTFAGTAGIIGSTNGVGVAAQFSYPIGVAINSVGNLYVTSGCTIRMITPAGVVTTFAGTPEVCGSSDGVGEAARFISPAGIAVDSVDNIYVADYGAHTIRKITPAGVATTLAGTAYTYGSIDGAGTTAQFYDPSGIAVDLNGNVYVTDFGSSTIRKITPSGVVSTFAGTAYKHGSRDGLGAAARFDFPNGIAIDSVGNIYVADSGNETVRRITPGGTVTTVAGVADVTGGVVGMLPGYLSYPNAIAVDANNVLYVSTGEGVVKIILQ